MAHNMFSAVASRNKPLVEFRAGRMRQRGKTVLPVPNKGLIQVVQNQDDGLIHLVWKDRATGQTESDFTILPGEATWKKVKQCTTGRVYLLEFKQQDRRLFFWLQEPSDEKDEENATKINQCINNPPAPEGGGGGSGGGAFGDLDQNQLLAMMGGGAPQRRGGTAPAAPTGAAPPPRPSGGQISNEQLQNILSGLGVDPSAAPQPSQPVDSRPDTPDINLPAVMNAEAILPLLNDPLVQERLLPLLPEGSRSREELQELLRSPQFQQAVSQLNSALHSGQLGQLMPMLGLPSAVGGPQGGVGALLQAIQEQARRNTSNQSSPAQEGKDEEKKDDDNNKDD